ncbi:phosphodiester glycosidase family protein [Gemmatimonas aurantiaca]|uniref:phosphodiester glycosidase family protein n=1 Tax=Gemmatimonas aurantiaca TaxID=173480 RepID=UPI00301D62B0
MGDATPIAVNKAAAWSALMAAGLSGLPGGLAAQPSTPRRIQPLSCSDALPAPSAPSLRWRGRDVSWAEWPVRLGTRAISATIIVVDIDPARIALSLDIARDGDALAPWSLDDAPADAALALNAGQFTDAGPWGWVIHRGREWQAPGQGPLSAAFAIDTSGRAVILRADEIADARRRGGWTEVLQSFPLILDDARMPPALCQPGAVDLEHRDIRLTIGTLPNGHVLLALTRYAGVGSAGSRLPIGPTTDEMATIMRDLGATRAVMLDGGLSAQLLLRDGSGGRDGDNTMRWNGLRRVPLALVGHRTTDRR